MHHDFAGSCTGSAPGGLQLVQQGKDMPNQTRTHEIEEKPITLL
jgi:hypothetical protein